MAGRIKTGTEGTNLRSTTDLSLQEAGRSETVSPANAEPQKSSPPSTCYISFGPPKPPQPTGKLSPSEILRQAKKLRDRLSNLQNSPSQTFNDFLKNFAPFEETKALATIAYWNTNPGNLAQIEQAILFLEEYERLLIAGERLRQEFPQGIRNDPTFQKIEQEDPEAAKRLEAAFYLMRGQMISVRPGTEPTPLFPPTYEGIYETLFQFTNADFKKFLDRASAEQGIGLHYEDFGFTFIVNNSCEPAPEPKKPSHTAPKRKDSKVEAAGREIPEVESRQKIFETTARLIGARQLAKILEAENPPALSLADLGKIRVGLEEELSSLMKELPPFLTAEQLRKIKNDLDYWMRSLKSHYHLFLPRDFAGVPLHEKIPLTPQTKELLTRISGETARLEAFLLTQRLQKEKEEISELGMEPSVRHRLNLKLSQLLKLGREGEPSDIPALASQIMTGIDRNTLRLSIARQIEAFSDPDGVIQRGYRDWKFLYGDYGPGMHPKNFEYAVSLLQQCDKYLAEGNVEEAQKLFAELSGSEFYKDLFAYLKAYQEHDVVRELAKGVAIVIVAGMTGGLVASTVAPYLEGSLLGKATLALIEGTAFVVTEKALSGEISPTKILNGETTVGQLTAETLIDIAFAAPMLAYLRKVSKISRGAIEGLKQKGFEKALLLSPRLAKRLKKLGPEGKVLEKIGEYLGDLVAFTAWEEVEGIGRQSLDGEIDFEKVAEQVWSWEGTYNRALFLGALKLGHHAASPAFQPIGGWVNDRTVKHHLKRLQAIQQETGGALRGLRTIGVKGAGDVEKLENDQLALLDPTFKRLLTLQKRKVAILSALEGLAPEGGQKSELQAAVAREKGALQEAGDFYANAQELKKRKDRWLPSDEAKEPIDLARVDHDPRKSHTSRLILEGYNAQLAEYDRAVIKREGGIEPLTAGERKILQDPELQKLDQKRTAFIDQLRRDLARIPVAEREAVRTALAQRPGPFRDQVIREETERILKALPFGPELRSRFPDKDPVVLLNQFLRGELGREPTHAEVTAMYDTFWRWKFSGVTLYDVGNNLRLPPEIAGAQPVYQIYTKELLDAMATYLERQILDFHTQQGRPPRLVEIAAGDGRLTRALNRRLAASEALRERGLSLQIQATDNYQYAGDGRIAFPPDVQRKEAVEAAKDGDILIGSSWPHRGPFEGRVGRELIDHPEKILILIHSGTRGEDGSPTLDLLVGSRLQLSNPENLNQTPDGKRLPTSTRPLFHNPEKNDLFTATHFGSDNPRESQVRVYRARTGPAASEARTTERAGSFYRAELARLNQELSEYDRLSSLKRQGTISATETEQLTSLERGQKAKIAERQQLIRSNYKYHDLVSGNTEGSDIRSHLEAHLSEVDLGSNFTFGQERVFQNSGQLLSFSETVLERAYRGELPPGTEFTATVNGKNAKVRIMQSDEVADGAKVGPSVAGGRVVVQVIFEEPIGKDGVVEISQVPPGGHVIVADRTSGGRTEKVYLVNGEKRDTSVMYIIGGTYGPTGKFGLYTAYTGRYAPPMNDTTYWGQRAFLMGDQRSFTVDARGQVHEEASTNLQKMREAGKVKNPRIEGGGIRRVADLLIDRLIVEKRRTIHYSRYWGEIWGNPQLMTAEQREFALSLLTAENLRPEYLAEIARKFKGKSPAELFSEGKLKDAPWFKDSKNHDLLTNRLSPEQKQAAWKGAGLQDKQNRFYERKQKELTQLYEIVKSHLERLGISPEGQTFVDIAGGAGDVSRVLVESFRTSRGTVLDFDRDQLSYARALNRRLGQNLETRPFDIRAEKIPDGLWVAKHPCGDLVDHIIQQWAQNPNSPALFIVTCCQGHAQNSPLGPQMYGIEPARWKELTRKSDWTSHPDEAKRREGYAAMRELDSARVEYLRKLGFDVELRQVEGAVKGNLIVAHRRQAASPPPPTQSAPSSNGKHFRWADNLVEQAKKVGDSSLLAQATALRERSKTEEGEELGRSLSLLSKTLGTRLKEAKAKRVTEEGDPAAAPWKTMGELEFLRQEGIIDEDLFAAYRQCITLPGAQQKVIKAVGEAMGSVRKAKATGNKLFLVGAYNNLKGTLSELTRQAQIHPASAPAQEAVAQRDLKVTFTGLRNGRRVEMTSAIEQDVPLDGHIWEIKDYRQWNAGSTEQVKNQALKYQQAINQGLFQGATIEVLGNVDPKFIQFLQEYAPDVELLYTLELPDGHEVSVVLKRASNGHSLASSKISERLTIRERRIADGLQAAVDRGDLSLLANDIIESVDLEGSSFKDELMKAYDPAVKRIDPTRIESLEAFREYDRLVHEKRWRIFGKAEPVAPVTKQTPGPVRTRQPFGVLYGGFTTAGQGVIIPHDGTVVKNEAGLEIRFNEQERCYEYRREGEDHWREISVAETIILSNPGDRLVQPRVYTLVTMEGLIDGDPYQQFDDLRTQAESQLHKNGIDPYLRKLGDRGSPIDRHNLEMLFSEAAKKAEAVYYQTAEGREIGMGMGHVRLFALIDRNGQITDFVQDAPEIDRLSKEGISQPPRPDGTTVVEIRLDNMTGQVLVNDRGLIVPSLTPAALARYNNLHRFVARVGPTFNGRTLQYLMSLPR